ncbi:Rv1157c family protein [Mycobacterium sp.]|uniref:Rv1157c family protein n=1 Tax=Mycobacterium sp. TaxID=1785 RepID=UPI003F998BDD
MVVTRNLISGLAAAALACSAAVALSPGALADPTPPQPLPAQQFPGLPALTELSPIIQQAAGNPEQATQLLMAAASAFTHNPTAPDQSKNVAASVNQFVQAPNAAVPADLNQPPNSAPTAHIVPPGVEPGAQAHLPTGIDPVHAAGPGPEAASAPATAIPVAAPVAPAGPPPAAAPAPAASPVGPPVAPAAAPAATPPVAPGFSPDTPPTQDFMYPSISSGCLADGGNVLATALSVAGPAKIPTPGPTSGQTAYVFTAIGTPGPADVQKLPLNVTWVNLTTGKSGSVTLKPQPDINPAGPTTLTAIADTGSGSVMSTIFGQVTTKDKQCQFMPTIGSTVVP